MIARLVMLWDRLRNSLWALPLLLVAAAAVLAVATLRLRIAAGHDPVWWLYSGTASAASGFLSSLLTAMITMATLAISITMVVLALAAQSLGPRLISIFMSDVRTKLTLGLFLGTVAYLLIVLRTVVSDTDAVPQLAVTLGTVLVIACVMTLLFFVHHLARSIVADTIIGRVGASLDAHIQTLMPNDATKDASEAPAAADIEAQGEPVIADAGGYVQFIDHQAIVETAREADASVILAFRPGQFVVAGETLAWIKPQPAAEPGRLQAIADAIVRGRERTAVQDIEYSIRQLVEIALRALSPGVNDPFTACAAIDRLTEALALMIRRQPQQTVWRDEADAVRLRAPEAAFDGILDAAFNQIRQAGATMPAVIIRLAERLGQLLHQADGAKAEAVLRHIRLVEQSGERGIADAADREALQTRIAAALEARHPKPAARKTPKPATTRKKST